MGTFSTFWHVTEVKKRGRWELSDIYKMLLFIHCRQCKPLISVSVCWLGVVSEEGYWDQSGLEGGEGNRWQKCCHRFLSGLQAFSPPQWFSASLLLGLQLWFCCATRSGHKRGSPRRWIQCWGFSRIISRHPQGTSSSLQLSTCPNKVHHAVAVLAGDCQARMS